MNWIVYANSNVTNNLTNPRKIILSFLSSLWCNKNLFYPQNYTKKSLTPSKNKKNLFFKNIFAYYTWNFFWRLFSCLKGSFLLTLYIQVFEYIFFFFQFRIDGVRKREKITKILGFLLSLPPPLSFSLTLSLLFLRYNRNPPELSSACCSVQM